MIIRLIFLSFILFLTSCNSIYIVKNRIKYADHLVKEQNFIQEIIKTNDFALFSYQKIINPKNKVLNIYIEGDGLAWENRYRLSRNPTPTDPIALKMALVDKAENIIYLARPCQYVDFSLNKNCANQEYWSRARFSQKVIDSTNQAIDKIKIKYGFKNINLFGFSGGGAVAVLVASKRSDVKSIKTIAANLNHKMLMKMHKVSPLDQSLDAIDVAYKLSKIRQIHIAGKQDNTVYVRTIESFVNKVNKNSKDKIAYLKIIKDANHEYKKWPEIWSNIINK